MTNQTKIDIKEAVSSYLKSVKLEWGKITWLPKQQILAETIYVVVIVTVFTIGVLAMDSIISGILKLLKLS
jgi:preprotein translocase SecE subunit